MSRFQSLVRSAAPLAVLALGACATPFQAQVNRFQSLSAAPQGQSFYVKAADQKLNGSLEFAQYAALVAKKLTQVGYQPAASADAANLLVTVDYGVDQGKEKTRVTPGYGYGGFGYGGYGRGYGGFGYGGFGGFAGYPYGGYGRSRYIYGFDDPFLFGGGYPEVEQYTVYTSGLDMKIERRSDGQRLFEGKAKAMSLNDNLTYLVPNLVEAMFTNFPGNSGETVKITVAPPSKK
jgi:hypothetical protein